MENHDEYFSHDFLFFDDIPYPLKKEKSAPIESNYKY